MAHNLDLRCVLAVGSQYLWVLGVPTKKRLESSIKKVHPFYLGCAGANKKASPPGRHQEQAPKQRCTCRPTTFSSVQFSSDIWLGLHWVLFYFFDHYIQSSASYAAGTYTHPNQNAVASQSGPANTMWRKLLYSGFKTWFCPSTQGAGIRYQNTSQIQIMLASHFEKKGRGARI